MSETAKEKINAALDSGQAEMNRIMAEAEALLSASKAGRTQSDSLLETLGITRTEARLFAAERGPAAHKNTVGGGANAKKKRRKTRTMV